LQIAATDLDEPDVERLRARCLGVGEERVHRRRVPLSRATCVLIDALAMS
jgi:hypothetical protein